MAVITQYVRRMKDNIEVSPRKADDILTRLDADTVGRVVDHMQRYVSPKYHQAILRVLTVAYVNELFRRSDKKYSLRQKHDFLTSVITKNRASREK